MGKWEMVRLGDVATIAAGQGAPQGDEQYSNGGIPFIKAGNLFDLANGASEFDIQQVSEKVISNYKLKMFPKDSIVFAKSGMSCLKGHVYVLQNNCCVVNHLACVIPNTISSSFLKYFLLKNRPNRLVKDESYPSISLSDISNMCVINPPLEVQRKIAETLDTASELLAMRKKQLAELDKLIQSVFYDMFGNPVTNEKGWEIVELGKEIKVIGGYAFKSGEFTETGIPVIKIGNINTGSFKDNNICFWNYDKSLERYLLKPGDVVISLTGTIGKEDYANVCILPVKFERYYLNQRNAKLELDESLKSSYLLYVLKEPKIKCQLTGISRGIRQANISNSDITSLAIPLPPIELQILFAETVQKIEEQKALVQKAIDETQALFDSLMNEYFE